MLNPNRWKYRFINFSKALLKLNEIISNTELKSLTEIQRDSLIKRFELTFELSWNVLKDFLEFQGETELYGSRNTYKKALQLGLIQEGEKWMEMIESRIQAAHTYDEENAIEIAHEIYSHYIVMFEKLKNTFDNELRP